MGRIPFPTYIMGLRLVFCGHKGLGCFLLNYLNKTYISALSSPPLNQQKQVWCKNSTVHQRTIFNNGIGCRFDLQISAMESSRVLKPALLCTSMPASPFRIYSFRNIEGTFLPPKKNCLGVVLGRHLRFLQIT